MTARTLRVVEDGGLAALVGAAGRGPAGGAEIIRSAEVRSAAAELLRAQLPAQLLDPVAPASERNPEVLRTLRAEVGRQTEAGAGPLRGVPTDEASLLALFRDSVGWGPAQPYLDDERIQEVKIIGDRIMVQEDGADFVMVPERFSSACIPLDLATNLASRLNVPLNMNRTQGTLPLAYGTRMHVTIPPCTPEGAALVCIRRGRRYAWQLEDIHRRGALSAEIRDLLLLLARARCSFLIAGETGSGKTALLEALINSWPGEPHVITVEDNALEIQVRHAAWTRELVQTANEPGAFGRAAREALRQTPTVVAPGETRAEEAGAILSIAVSGHAVVTTLHAKSCAAAVTRFADCAAMPGAFVYEGRRGNALEDTCDNIEVVVHVEKLSGRRYVREIALLGGLDRAAGHPRPALIPLAEASVDDAGRLVWHCAARAEGDALAWGPGEDRTPPQLRQKLRMLRAEGRVRAAPTTRAAVEDALERAQQALRVGQADLALAGLRRAWSDRRDERLIGMAARALEGDRAAADAARAEALRAAERIAAALARREWGAAGARLQQVLGDLALVAAHTPPGGWAALGRRVAEGEEADAQALSLAARARAALDGGHAQDALDILMTVGLPRIGREAAGRSLRVRRDALRHLVAAGASGPAPLEMVERQLAALHGEEDETWSRSEAE